MAQEIAVMIGEKPKVVSRIAQALGDYSIKENRGVKNYVIEAGERKIIVAPAVGHVFNLEQVDGEWTYPVFEVEWRPIFETEDDAGYVKKYYRNLQDQLEKADTYINACDFDIEGSVIGYNVIHHMEDPPEERIERMKFSTLTSGDLREAFDDLEPFDSGMTQAGITRHVLDFYYGINVSRALMQAVRENDRYKTLSTGRVQGPTLKVLADREREIKAFDPDPYWELYLIHQEFEAQWEDDEDRIWEQETAEKIFSEVKDNRTAEVTDIDRNDYKHGAPIPFNLTGLQSESSSQFSISPKRTQQLAQELYEQGLISYPRTESQKLPAKIGYEQLLEKLKNQDSYQELAEKVLDKDEIYPRKGSKEDDAHPCFTPETEISFNPNSRKFSELVSEVEEWAWDEEKQSYYGEIKRSGVISHSSGTRKSEVVGIWKTPYEGELLDIRTGGKQVKVTPNHRFLTFTEKGLDYVEAENLREKDVIFRENEKSSGSIDISDYISLQDAFSEKHWEEIKSGDSRVQETFNRIKELVKDLEHSKAEKLASIAGFCFGDGHIHFKKPSRNREKYPNVLFTGRIEDIKELKSDIESLGFSAYISRKEPKKAMLASKDSAFGRLLIALGCPTGDKMTKEYTVPEWIKLEKTLKKEFLGGIFGAELTKVRIHSKNGRDIRPFRFEQNKIEGKKESFKDFLQELMDLCDDLDIETGNLSISEKVEARKKDGKKTVKGNFSIKNNRDNLERFVNTVPMRYSNYKDKLRRKASAYLALRKSIVLRRKEKRQKAKQMYSEGKGYKEIGEMTGISRYTVKSWVYYGNGGKEEHLPPAELPEFKDFNLKTPEETEPQLIQDVTREGYEGSVYDIEVERYHNYFANHFLVHNCIYPTGEPPSGLSKQQRQVYDLIVKRFFAVFGDSAKRRTLTFTLEVNRQEFFAQSKVTVERNWFDLYEPYVNVDEAELPEMETGEVLEVEEFDLREKETQPPRRYSQSGIVNELEKRNLGTKATRAQTVDRLYSRNFIDNNPIEVTQLGLAITETLEEHVPALLSEDLTREFEQKMEAIRNGDETSDEVISEAREELEKILGKFKQEEKEIGAELVETIDAERKRRRQLGPCQECDDGTLRIVKTDNGRFVGCSNYPDCENTYPLPGEGKIESLDEQCEECGTPRIKVIRKGRKPYDMCINPDCSTKDDW